LKLRREGKTYPEIADALGISTETVKTHIKWLMANGLLGVDRKKLPTWMQDLILEGDMPKIVDRLDAGEERRFAIRDHRFAAQFWQPWR
jgi:predicted transcriptional regulator